MRSTRRRASGHSACVLDDNEIRQRERRQLALMIDRLDRFRSGELSIGPVITDLEALLEELQLVDDAWRDDFREAWADLEIPYAVALDRQTPIPTATDATVGEGIASLDRLVHERLRLLGDA
jgi:hypothetical protein